MVIWNAQPLNRLKATVEAGFARRIADAAAKRTGMKFQHGRTHGTTSVWTTDPDARVREYGDGVKPSDPWANAAIKEGVYGRNH